MRTVNRVTDSTALERLTALVEEESARIVRRWGKRLRAEFHDLDMLNVDVRAPLAPQIRELARLLRARGADAIALFAEAVRVQGPQRYDQHFNADDLARQYKALGQVLMQLYVRRFGAVDEGAADLILELVGEANAAVQASFARVLRTEEVRFREASVMESVLHHVEVGIWVVEPDGTLSYATPPLAKLLGLPLRALVGGRAREVLGPILRELHARHLNGDPFRINDMPFLRALAARERVRGVRMVITRPNGEEAILEMAATPLYEDEEHGDAEHPGELAGVIQAFTDRSESAQKNQELARAYDALRKLQGRLLHHTRTQALGQLASGAAHALNNFLNVLRLRLTLLRREFKVEHLDALDRTARNIAELASRLQELGVQRTEETLASADFGAVLDDVLSLARGELLASPVQLETALAGTGRTRVDEGFFRELVVNLLVAARERMPGEAGGTLRVTSSAAEGWLQLDIEDSGAPYPPQALQNLFDPLGGHAADPGLSLLLAVARSQVQRWGGGLTCDNSLTTGGGAFHLRLPLEEPAPELLDVPPPRSGKPPSRTVLVVDDEVENGRALAEVLRDEGYTVDVASSGLEALRLWGERSYDAAILDALMPDMSGWELARELRKRSVNILLALLTGMDVRAQNHQNLALVDAVFQKPVDVAALDDFLSSGRSMSKSSAPSAVH